MRIATTYENGEIFQHFGHSRQFKLYDVEEGKIVKEQIVDTNGSGHGALAEGNLSYDPDAKCDHHGQDPVCGLNDGTGSCSHYRC